MENNTLLKDRVLEELEAFRKPYVSGEFDNTQIYNDWYIIGFYEAYWEMLTCDWTGEQGYAEDALAWLSSLESPLGFLYEEWLNCDSAFSQDWDDMLDFICVTYREEQKKDAPSLDAQIAEAQACPSELHNDRTQEPQRGETSKVDR